MKKLCMFLTLLLVMTMGSYRVFAQSVTITLMPGWNWISVPLMDTLDFETALGSFTPVAGDMIKSQWSNASYKNGQWRGPISQFYPGYGYMYKSNRPMPVMLTFNVQQPAPQVVVTTSEPVDITTNSATCGGNVASSNGDFISVTHKGICWSTTLNPTFNDNYIEIESGLGSFTISMNELTIGTTYYIRAFAVTENGTVYGDQKAFTTKDGIPVLTTAEITNVGRHGAICGGNITDDGGLSVTARGVCWSTNPNPTITDSHTDDGTGIGDFISCINGLTANTTYNVRAYATNSAGTVYGSEISITTDSLVPVGAINGLFTINANGDQVYFSQGNLQYIGSASTPYWKFADNQWDYFGGDTGQASTAENIDRDLFSWGTSGYNHGAICYQPWQNCFGNTNYYAYSNPSLNLYCQADWGYNVISNGGNLPGQWRTLTSEEWGYVISRNERVAKAIVNGIKGVILLPDNWDVETYQLNYNSGNYASNAISSAVWIDVLEPVGAVFLPSAGRLYSYWGNGSDLTYSPGGFDNYGWYWSSSVGTNTSAYVLYILHTGMQIKDEGRSFAYSVRLVQEY
jgi:hypothetical protein